jgi:hypothetical protein
MHLRLFRSPIGLRFGIGLDFARIGIGRTQPADKAFAFLDTAKQPERWSKSFSSFDCFAAAFDCTRIECLLRAIKKSSAKGYIVLIAALELKPFLVFSISRVFIAGSYLLFGTQDRILNFDAAVHYNLDPV